MILPIEIKYHSIYTLKRSQVQFKYYHLFDIISTRRENVVFIHKIMHN